MDNFPPAARTNPSEPVFPIDYLVRFIRATETLRSARQALWAKHGDAIDAAVEAARARPSLSADDSAEITNWAARLRASRGPYVRDSASVGRDGAKVATYGYAAFHLRLKNIPQGVTDALGDVAAQIDSDIRSIYDLGHDAAIKAAKVLVNDPSVDSRLLTPGTRDLFRPREPIAEQARAASNLLTAVINHWPGDYEAGLEGIGAYREALIAAPVRGDFGFGQMHASFRAAQRGPVKSATELRQEALRAPGPGSVEERVVAMAEGIPRGTLAWNLLGPMILTEQAKSDPNITDAMIERATAAARTFSDETGTSRDLIAATAAALQNLYRNNLSDTPEADLLRAFAERQATSYQSQWVAGYDAAARRLLGSGEIHTAGVTIQIFLPTDETSALAARAEDQRGRLGSAANIVNRAADNLEDRVESIQEGMDRGLQLLHNPEFRRAFGPVGEEWIDLLIADATASSTSAHRWRTIERRLNDDPVSVDKDQIAIANIACALQEWAHDDGNLSNLYTRFDQLRRIEAVAAVTREAPRDAFIVSGKVTVRSRDSDGLVADVEIDLAAAARRVDPRARHAAKEATERLSDVVAAAQRTDIGPVARETLLLVTSNELRQLGASGPDAEIARRSLRDQLTRADPTELGPLAAEFVAASAVVQRTYGRNVPVLEELLADIRNLDAVREMHASDPQHPIFTGSITVNDQTIDVFGPEGQQSSRPATVPKAIGGASEAPIVGVSPLTVGRARLAGTLGI